MLSFDFPNSTPGSGRSTSELTGAQRHCAARRTLISAPCGAMPLCVRVERPVKAQAHGRSSSSSAMGRKGLPCSNSSGGAGSWTLVKWTAKHRDRRVPGRTSTEETRPAGETSATNVNAPAASDGRNPSGRHAVMVALIMDPQVDTYFCARGLAKASLPALARASKSAALASPTNTSVNKTRRFMRFNVCGKRTSQRSWRRSA